MARVRSLAFAGKSVNATGHVEHRGDGEKNVVDFDANGLATVSDALAASLVEMYPRQIELVPAGQEAPVSKPKS